MAASPRLLAQLTDTPSPTLSRDGWLAALCFSRTLIAFNFIVYAACLPVLQREWGMTATAAGSIASAFQLGYGASLLVASWLADRVGARNVFRVSSVACAVAIVLFAALARSYASALVLYALVAVAQGGTYTTAIMLVAARYEPRRRGTAMGWFLGASSLGYAISLLLIGVALPFGGYPLAFAITAAATVLGCGIALAMLRNTPNVVHPRPERSPFAAAVLRNRKAMLLIGGYTAHSWELLGLWAWTPAFLAAALAMNGAAALTAAEFGAYLTAGLHLTGLVSSWSMGFLSDRLGRRTVLVAMAGISAACSLLFGWTVAWPIWLVVALGAVYSFTAIGDSSVLSTATTEAVDPAHLGATLALRSILGFGAGAIAPLAFGAVLDATNATDTAPTLWGWAFAVLGLGGIVATACALALRRESP